ncbi:MAG: PEP-CTERM sorting domain-containing protein [Sedimentisphaerales bacterium]
MRRETHLKSIPLYAAIVLFATVYARAGTWTTLDYPGAWHTTPSGISGSEVFGSYWQPNVSRGFLYDGTTWTTLDYPGAIETVAYDISGNNIVGYCLYSSHHGGHGFLYTVPEPATLFLLGLGLATARPPP